ncbi:MAG TPA: hypothetical protein VHB46_04425 [Burkholderiales bacterium]|nr:hypothetical protein [Burkholderiales bacterium]
MKTWYCLQLGNGGQAMGPCNQIQETFLALSAHQGHRLDLAVFYKHDPASREITAYFSPGAHQLALHFDAIPCARPEPEGLEILAGDDRCWDLVFGGDQPNPKQPE